MIKSTHSKVKIPNFGIYIIPIEHYNYSMNTTTLKSNNLEKLLDGLSLLDEKDQERIISVVDALGFAAKKTEKAYPNTPPKTTEKRNRNGDSIV